MITKKELLQRLFLNEAESSVYLYLLGVTSAGISDIAKNTPYHRPRVTEVVKQLMDKQLVKIIGDKRKSYAAESPNRLIDRAQEIAGLAKTAVPLLFSEQLKKQPKQSMRVYEGEEGLSACFLDVVQRLSKGELFYRISSAKDQQFVDSLVPKEYRPLRDAKQLERRVITSKYVGLQKKPRLERSIKFFEEDDALFEHNIIQFIYDDTVSLLDFSSLTATVIRNRALADFQKSIFSSLYKKLG